MASRAKPAAKPAVAAKPAPPRPKKVILRDLSAYGRSLKLPSSFQALGKDEISNDFRTIASLPLLGPEEAENDSILIANAKRLPQEVRANLPSGAPDPEAALPKPQEEGPKVIRMLESVVFGEKDEDEDDPASILEPSRLMSGWVAARLAGEEASRTLFVDGTPGFLSSATGNTIPANLSATAAAVKLANGQPIPAFTPQGAAAGTPFFNAAAPGGSGSGSSSSSSSAPPVISYSSSNPARAINGGLPVGAGPIRLEMSLKERLAALSCRREERDKRALALRRYYVQQLRNYTLETKEHEIVLNQLRNEVTAARSSIKPYRSPLFASDEEEWRAVANIVAASHSVMRQNRQLRARLAGLLKKDSGNADDIVDWNDSDTSAEYASENSQPPPIHGIHYASFKLSTDGQTGIDDVSVNSGGFSTLARQREAAAAGNNGSSSSSSSGSEAMVLVGDDSSSGSSSSSGGANMGGSRPLRRRPTPQEVAEAELRAQDKAQRAAARANIAAAKKKGTNQQVAKEAQIAQQEEAEDEAAEAAEQQQAKYRLPKRCAARRMALESMTTDKDTIFALGDLVLTPYGRGVVIKQRDRDGIVVVRLKWMPTGAAYLNSRSVTLLAVAGEEYTAPESTDSLMMFTQQPSTTAIVTRPATKDSKAADPDLLIYGGEKARKDFQKYGGSMEPPPSASPTAASARSPSASAVVPHPLTKQRHLNGEAGPTGTSSSSAIVTSITSAGAPLAVGSALDKHHGGLGSIEAEALDEEELDNAIRMTRKLRPKSATGTAMLSSRVCVFRSSWSFLGAPRGVPLRIDPSRGIQTTGFITSTMDGLGDGQHAFVPGTSPFAFGGHHPNPSIPTISTMVNAMAAGIAVPSMAPSHGAPHMAAVGGMGGVPQLQTPMGSSMHLAAPGSAPGSGSSATTNAAAVFVAGSAGALGTAAAFGATAALFPSMVMQMQRRGSFAEGLSAMGMARQASFGGGLDTAMSPLPSSSARAGGSLLGHEVLASVPPLNLNQGMAAGTAAAGAPSSTLLHGVPTLFGTTTVVPKPSAPSSAASTGLPSTTAASSSSSSASMASDDASTAGGGAGSAATSGGGAVGFPVGPSAGGAPAGGAGTRGGASTAATSMVGGGTGTTSSIARLKAEVTRLTYQLRVSEESRRDQRKRLTEARQAMARLLEQLNEARAQLTAVGEEVARRDTAIEVLALRCARLEERFASEAGKATWSQLRAVALKTTTSSIATADKITAMIANAGEQQQGQGGQGGGDALSMLEGVGEAAMGGDGASASSSSSSSAAGGAGADRLAALDSIAGGVEAGGDLERDTESPVELLAGGARGKPPARGGASAAGARKASGSAGAAAAKAKTTGAAAARGSAKGSGTDSPARGGGAGTAAAAVGSKRSRDQFNRGGATSAGNSRHASDEESEGDSEEEDEEEDDGSEDDDGSEEDEDESSGQSDGEDNNNNNSKPAAAGNRRGGGGSGVSPELDSQGEGAGGRGPSPANLGEAAAAAASTSASSAGAGGGKASAASRAKRARL